MKMRKMKDRRHSWSDRNRDDSTVHQILCFYVCVRGLFECNIML